ncbi:O-antigen ligase family protein [Cellulomonas aerilata]|uniref:O-antigen ligase family protein n=1 Tax=Cellulomonas aerilata TaxID=515326 RepID=UPI0011BF505E|nr:O-antigen ligase family protein [Cellulomonas aerilata]
MRAGGAGDPWARPALWALALVPVAMVPGGLFRFAVAKLLVAVVAVGLAALARPAGRLPRPVGVVLGVGALVLVTSALSSAAPAAQLLGRWPRYEGLVALPVYVGALWAGARLLGPAAPVTRLRTLRTALAVVATVVGVVGAVEAGGGRPLGGDAARPGSLLGNATDLGLVGTVVLAVLLLPAWRERRPVVVLGAVAAATAVVASGSRAAALAALAAVVVLAASEVLRHRGAPGPRSWRLPPAALACLAAGAALAAALAAVPATRDRLLRLGDLSGGTVGGRRLLWADAGSLASDHPLLGVGPSGFVDAVAGRHSQAWALQVGSADPPDSPHAWPLQALLAGGMPLLVLAVVLAVTVVRLGARSWRLSAGTSRADLVPGALAATGGYGLALLTHFTTPGTTPVVALLVGAMVATAPAASREPGHGSPAGLGAPRGRTSRLVAAGAGVWGLALAAGTAAEVPLAGAVTAAAAGHTERATAGFDAAARLRPWDRDVALIAAQAFHAGSLAGDPASGAAALTWSERALTAAPDSLEAALVHGYARGVVGQVGPARAELDLLTARAPWHPDVRLAAGVLAAQGGDTGAAEEHFRTAARYAPADPLPWENLAIVYRFTGRPDLAAAAEATARRLGGDRSG